ncbi:hypothetical protein JCM10908_004826 [Rhodotorula pacifica]|uniref:uncharacterized protein n=1 Tax=Rhodotorula pacifica TaxID=1495444 RepID=UPI003179ADC9
MVNSRLLNLPDDLILRIFTLAYDLEAAPLYEWLDGGCLDPQDRPRSPSVRRTFINKRIYKLCRPAWLRHVHIPSDVNQRAIVINGLLDNRAYLSRNLVLDGKLDRISRLHLAGLAEITPLSRLVVSFETTTPVAEVANVLQALSHTKSLYLRYIKNAPGNLLTQPAPNVTELEISVSTGNIWMARRLLDMLPDFDTLRLRVDTLQNWVVPWRRLKELYIGALPNEDKFLRFSFDFSKDAWHFEHCLPLRKLVLDLPISGTDTVGKLHAREHVFSAARAGKLFQYCRNLVEVDIRRLSHAGSFPELDGDHRRVLILRLQGTCNMTSSSATRNLFRFVQSLPELRTLELADFVWTHRPKNGATLPSFHSVVSFNFDHAVLFGFLRLCAKPTSRRSGSKHHFSTIES